jgi:hypothetical protein
MLSHGGEQIVAKQRQTLRVQDRTKVPWAYREELERRWWRLLRQQFVNPWATACGG